MQIRGINIGKGKPKICVPITAGNKSMAVEEAGYISEYLKDCVDMVELRIDYLVELKTDALAGTLQEVREKLVDIPLLCTLRTLKEGGEQMVTAEEYEEILKRCIHSHAIDIIDVEFYSQPGVFEHICEEAAKEGVSVLASNHDFQKTPPKDELVSRYQQMANAGADIAKIAVMPGCEEDVLTLLGAGLAAKTCLDIPFVAISMGKMGAISRICGERFGSCITFGVGRKSSAPGQIEAAKLKEIMNVLA